MKSMVLITGMLLIIGCAANYNNMIINDMNSEVKSTDDQEVQIELIKNPLKKSKNIRFDTRISRLGIKLIGLKIINNSNSDFNFNFDMIKITDSDGTNIEFLNADTIKTLNSIELKTWPYFFWSPLLLTINGAPIPLGLMIAVTNYQKARKTNAVVKEDIFQNYLKSQIIKNNEAASGVLALNISNKSDKKINHNIVLKIVDSENEEINKISCYMSMPNY
jgi:hypothetical protein